MQDRLLLRRFVMFHCEAAFAELVQRHERLVYAAALREVGDRQTAEDVTQAVFLILARKAPALWHHATLTGWLFHTARLAGKSALRQERRRRQREQAAAQSLAPASACPPDDGTLRLNEALSALRPHEREAVLLRFFEDASFPEVGAALGVSEDTAQKRVSRALDKMRAFLSKQQDTPALSVAVLTSLLAAEAARSVPLGCGEAVLHVLPSLKITVGTGFPLSSRAHQISRGVLHTMKAKSIAKAATVCAVACVSISALWAGSSPGGSIVGTWTCQIVKPFVRNHLTYNNVLTMQMTYNRNGTFTGKALGSTTGTSSLPLTDIIFAGRYTLAVVKKTGNATTVRVSETITQATKNGKPMSFPQSTTPTPFTLSGDGKTMTTVSMESIYSVSGKFIRNQADKQVWHRQ